MKKSTLFLLVCNVSIGAMAQTSHKLTTNRNAYRAADEIVKQQVEYKDPGSNGRNLTWDFRMVQPQLFVA